MQRFWAQFDGDFLGFCECDSMKLKGDSSTIQSDSKADFIKVFNQKYKFLTRG